MIGDRQLTQVHLACIVAARPNFMKMAPLLRALAAYPHLRPTLIHTGQHYDENLSGGFFKELGIASPDIHLDAGSGKHGEQTARVIERLEPVLEKGPEPGARFARLVVVGDVNSTMAAAIAAVKLGIPVAHVEAGLRSFDRSMPEEINRIVTDSVSDMLFVSEPAGMDNLRREGHPDEQLHLVGNVMIDNLLNVLPQARQPQRLDRFGLEPGRYGVVTMHRPSNVDRRETLAGLLRVLAEISERLPLVFSVHPRTQRRIEEFGLIDDEGATSRMQVIEPLGFIDFLALTSQAAVVVTDSGGLQEESTVLGVPCLTLRSNTERPITVTQGTSTLVGNDPGQLRHYLDQILDGTYKRGTCLELWDGKAAARIAAVLAQSETLR